MSEKLTDESGVEIVLSRTREDYRPLPPAALAQHAGAHARLTPPAPPNFLERIERLYAHHGPQNVTAQSFTRKFAMLPNADQASLLRSATDAEFVTYARHARPAVRMQAQDERRARQIPRRLGP